MENIKCPITKNKFYEPYVLSSGYTFEETVINNNSLSRCPLTHIEFKFTTDPTIDGRNYNNKIIQKPIPNILLSKCMMHINETYSNFSDNLLKCPITGKIFKEPVIIFSGITYEKQALQEYHLKDRTKSEDYHSAVYLQCPKTHEKKLIYITEYEKYIYPNYAIKNIVEDYLKKNPTKRNQQYMNTKYSDSTLLTMKTTNEINDFSKKFEEMIYGRN
jgi:hypothetical protein